MRPAIAKRMQDAMEPTEKRAEQPIPDAPQGGAGMEGGQQDGGDAVQALEQELAALREERLRERADTENQRRRMQRDLDQARRFANERLLADLLPVLDSLERGLEAGGTDVASFREGVELTLRQLLKVAADHGLHVVDPTDQAFDPERHEAMSVVPTNERPPNEVVQVFQKGYVLNDRLLRPALVVVSREPDGG